MRSRLLIALLAGAATVIATSAAPAAAGAAVAKKTSPASAELPALVSATPVGYTPNVYAGSSCGSICNPSTVYATAVVGDEVVVGGAFTQVCSPAPGATYAPCPSDVTANYIFAYNLQTGAIDPNFAPAISQGPVYALAAGTGDTVYVGSGSGLSEVYVDPGQSDDGTAVPGFSATVNGAVYNLAYNGSALYAGGTFKTVDGTTQAAVARLSSVTGALDPSFAITLSDNISGTTLQVQAMSLTPDGTMLAIGGSFQEVNGQSIPRVALINTGAGYGVTATVDNWTAPILDNACYKQHNYVNGIDFSPDGSFFVLDDTGYHTAGGAALCDAAARFETDATGDDVQPVWVNYSGGDSFHSVVVTGSVVYLGGHNRWLNNECGNNKVCEANAVLVDGLGAVDANTGLALPFWQPQTSRGVGVASLTAVPPGAGGGSAGGLIIGTDVDVIGGQTHSELAMFPLTSDTTPAAGGPIQSGMFSDGRIGGTESTGNGKAAMCVDDTGNSQTPGTAVKLVTCSNDAEQNWTLGSGGTIGINGLCLDTAGEATSSGAKVVANTCSSADTTQDWTQGTGDTLVNTGAAGMCLTDPNASTTTTQLQIQACGTNTDQSWPLPVAQAPPPPPVTGPIYSNLVQSNDQVPCLNDVNDKTKATASVDIYSCEGLPAQTWTLQSNGTIQVNGLCLDTSGGATGSGTTVVLNACDGAATQQWAQLTNYTLEDQGASGMCLTVSNTDVANKTSLEISACQTSGSGLQGQQWRLPAA